MAKTLPDDLGVHILGRALFNSESAARPIIEYLLRAGRFSPQNYGSMPPLRNHFKGENLDRILRQLINPWDQESDQSVSSGDIWLNRRKRPKIDGNITWIRSPHRPFASSFLHVDSKYMISPANLSDWCEFCLPLFLHLNAWFAAICLRREWEDRHDLTYRKQRLPDWSDGYIVEGSVGNALENGVPGIYWGTYFGPFYVDWFGREKFETLPYVKKEELSTGGIFFTTAETPFDWDKPDTRVRQRAVMKHLGLDAFFDREALRAKMTEIGEPFPDDFDPRTLVPKHRVPEFPFLDEMQPPEKSREEKIEENRRYFEHHGFTFEGEEGDVLMFVNAEGGKMQIDLNTKQIDHHLE